MANELLANGNNQRQVQWTESIAVGHKSFIEKTNQELGTLAKGRRIHETEECSYLREETAAYIANYDRKNDNIGMKNTFSWNFNDVLSAI